MLSILNKYDNLMISSSRACINKTTWGVQVVKALFLYLWISFIMGLALIIAAGVTLLINENAAKIVFKSEYSTNLISIVGIWMTMIFTQKIDRLNITAIGLQKQNRMKNYLLGIALGTLAFGIILFVGYMAQDFVFVQLNPIKNPLPIMVCIIAYVINALFEEMFFRGYVMSSIMRRNKITTAILVNSTIFMITHVVHDMFDIVGMINAFLFGVAMSLVVIKTDNIFLASGIHAAWNITQGCVCGFNVSGHSSESALFTFKESTRQLLSGGKFGPNGSLTTTVIILIIISITILRLISIVNEKEISSEKQNT